MEQTTQKILFAIAKSNGRIAQTKLTRNYHLNVAQFNKSVLELLELGLINRQKTGNLIEYQLSEKGKSHLPIFLNPEQVMKLKIERLSDVNQK